MKLFSLWRRKYHIWFIPWLAWVKLDNFQKKVHSQAFNIKMLEEYGREPGNTKIILENCKHLWMSYVFPLHWPWNGEKSIQLSFQQIEEVRFQKILIHAGTNSISMGWRDSENRFEHCFLALKMEFVIFLKLPQTPISRVEQQLKGSPNKIANEGIWALPK